MRDLSITTRLLMEATSELDNQHTAKEKLISELKSLITESGYRALDFTSDDIVGRLYLIATVRPETLGEALSYHKSKPSQFYAECLRTLEYNINLKLNYAETAVDIDKTVTEMVRRVFATDSPQKVETWRGDRKDFSSFYRYNKTLSRMWSGKTRIMEKWNRNLPRSGTKPSKHSNPCKVRISNRPLLV